MFKIEVLQDTLIDDSIVYGLQLLDETDEVLAVFNCIDEEKAHYFCNKLEDCLNDYTIDEYEVIAK